MRTDVQRPQDRTHPQGTPERLVGSAQRCGQGRASTARHHLGGRPEHGRSGGSCNPDWTEKAAAVVRCSHEASRRSAGRVAQFSRAGRARRSRQHRSSRERASTRQILHAADRAQRATQSSSADARGGRARRRCRAGAGCPASTPFRGSTRARLPGRRTASGAATRHPCDARRGNHTAACGDPGRSTA